MDEELLEKVVLLGSIIRGYRDEGQLRSVPPPSLYGYLAFLRLAEALPHLSLQHVAFSTLLGNAGPEDLKTAGAAFNEAFGIHADPDDDDPTFSGDLF